MLSPAVLVADRHRLDSELLAASLSSTVSARAIAPAQLPAALSEWTTSLVLIDAECPEETFDAASRWASAVGLLFDSETPRLRQRTTGVQVRLALFRHASVADARDCIEQVLAGHRYVAIPQPRRCDSAGPSLSRREVQVLTLMARGLANRDIAVHLDISPHTVRTHVQSVLAKLDRSSRIAAVGAARQAGLLTP